MRKRKSTRGSNIGVTSGEVKQLIRQHTLDAQMVAASMRESDSLPSTPQSTPPVEARALGGLSSVSEGPQGAHELPISRTELTATIEACVQRSVSKLLQASAATGGGEADGAPAGGGESGGGRSNGSAAVTADADTGSDNDDS